MFVLDAEDRKVYAVSMADQTRDEPRDIALDPENANAEGLWYGGGVLWVVDAADDKLYAYSLANFGLPVNNIPPTGVPTITGVAQVFETLTADTSAIFDGNGIFDGAFSYRWFSRITGRDYFPIAGATDSTYRLKRSDEGKTIKVEVSFTDSAGSREGPLTSAATAAVLAAGSSDIELSWAHEPFKTGYVIFNRLRSYPIKLGYEVLRSQKNHWGTYGAPELLAEVWYCDYELEQTERSCSFLENFQIGAETPPPSEEFQWVDESAQPGMSYRYTIWPFQEFFSDDGVTVWEHPDRDTKTSTIIGDPSKHRPYRVRIHGDMTTVHHRIDLAGEPATPTNLRLSESQPGEDSNGVVLIWDAAANATTYNIYIYDPEAPLYDKEPPHSKRRNRIVSGIKVTTWTDTNVTQGRKYTYRV